MGNEESKSSVFVANDSKASIRVLITPTNDFAFQKYFARNYGQESLSKINIEVNSAADILKEWCKERDQKEALTFACAVKEFFKMAAFEISTGTARDVYDKTLCNPLDYLTAYGWGILNTSGEVCLTVLVELPGVAMKLGQFSTMENWSWIVNDDFVTLSKCGTLWQNRLPNGHQLRVLNIKGI